MTHLKSTAVGLALAAALTLPTAARATTVAEDPPWVQELTSHVQQAVHSDAQCNNAHEVGDDSGTGAYCTKAAGQWGMIAVEMLEAPKHPYHVAGGWPSARTSMAWDLMLAAEARSKYNRPAAFAQANSALAILKDVSNRYPADAEPRLMRRVRELIATF